MENTPVAPDATPAASEATPQANTTPDQPAAPEITAEQVAKYLKTTPEVLAEIVKTYEVNGGAEKVLKRTRSIISNPQQAAAEAQSPEAPAQPQAPVQPTAPEAPKAPAKGTIGADDVLMKSYGQQLAAEEKYAAVKDDILSGKFMEEAAKLGITPMTDGRINDEKLRAFLDVYVKTAPSTPASNPVTTTPTVEWTEIQGDKIATQDDALRVIQQSMQMRAQGKGDHPLYKQAQEFMTKDYSSRHPESVLSQLRNGGPQQPQQPQQ